jgi:hypothetical protein
VIARRSSAVGVRCGARRRPRTGEREDQTMRWMVITLVAIAGLLFLLEHVVTHLFN